MWLALDVFDLDRNFQVFDNSQGSETSSGRVARFENSQNVRNDSSSDRETSTFREFPKRRSDRTFLLVHRVLLAHQKAYALVALPPPQIITKRTVPIFL